MGSPHQESDHQDRALDRQVILILQNGVEQESVRLNFAGFDRRDRLTHNLLKNFKF